MIGNLHGQREIDTHEQDSTSPLFQFFLMNEQKDDIVLTAPVALDDEVISVDAGHGFTGAAGEVIVLWENNRFVQLEVTGVSTNDISVNMPVDNPFTVAGAIVIRGNILMNVNGSSTPVDFLLKLQDFTLPIDISSAIMTMFHSAAGDDGKFGGIVAIANGLWFRKDNTQQFNLGNYKNNQDFKNVGAKVNYTLKGPAGTNATDITFDIKTIFGQVIRLDARINDIFRGQIRDALQTLTSFTLSLIGSYTSGE